MPVDEGQAAPAIRLTDQSGRMHDLAAYAGHWVILFFYPKDDTSGCTSEACQFRDALPAFDRAAAKIFGISPDDERSHAKFASKYELPYPLLADVPTGDPPAPAVCTAYGTWQEKSMYGRRYMGVVRTTFLIDSKGVVRRRWDKVKVPGHAEDVLRTLAGLA
jgi:thioredoxin-dependent peroxiredoxin